MKRRNCNPLNDYLFKFIFGREERKRITLNFLNAVLDLNDMEELRDITFIDRDLEPEFEEDKLSRLDLYGVANDGSRINIEVQLVNWRNMEKRTLYYWAKMYQSIHRGEDYVRLNRAITINLLNFILLPQPKPHTMYGLYDLQSGHRLTEDIEIHFIEVPKFEVKSIKELKRLEKWMAYFSNKLNDEEMEELAMSETAIREALDAEHIFMQDDIERWQYEQREKAVRDYISAMHASRDEGMELATLQNLKTLMKNMNLSAEKAMDALQISASKRQKYRALLHDS
ncbi:hypothetical protein HMPREF9081_2448 [Centipeda periodontii DSM 2778]|jgi:hypothetical protein|uniref:Rpn family recombination-promoting nuclease/putative transposase n=1 Tax=Centipeda periodontii DSM 2778 TaxID=888060 RepID=F5RQB2_9FIRM|nr:Rpn family recombination-promoting nuclease/putative transposase [Centipeda periodontii]EGK56946.1 hypothetical protein HMPREF9081_2448 [Centipeda periodontii DSM 2778]